MNINAAKGLHDVMKSNLGPKGTIKMLVGGSGGSNNHKIRDASQ
jgi:T-complex protein 1 subunit zeta